MREKEKEKRKKKPIFYIGRIF